MGSKKSSKSAKKYLSIEVTAEDIENGERDSSSACPIALAVDRSVIGLDFFSVSHFYIRLNFKNGTCMYFCLDKKTSDFIDRFDAGKSVKPIAVKLPLPALPW